MATPTFNSSNGGGEGDNDVSIPIGISDPLNDTVIDLRTLLETERALNRKHLARIRYFEGLLREKGIDFSLEGDESLDEPEIEAFHKELQTPSLVNEAFDKYFNSVADNLKEAKPSSETTIRIKNLSYNIQIPRGGKSFPTVTEAICLPFKQTCGPKQQPRTITILEDISTVLEPGNFYLVLGPPKSGKTSLLKAIAGRLVIAKGGSLSGEITYNGDTSTSGRFEITSVAAFVEQYDNHEPYMTVRETFQFSGACTVPVMTPEMLQTRYMQEFIRNLDLDDSTKKSILANKIHPAKVNRVIRAVAKHRTRMVLALLGLKRCAETIIGNERVRGVSGGERRRVTLGEMIMGASSIACFDEISTGLDSAATYDIIRMLKSATQAFKYVSCVSLLQPPPEVYNLFDEVLVMREGRLIYQGPSSQILSLMSSWGYPCPLGKDHADFLVEVNSLGLCDEFLARPEKRRELGAHEPPPKTSEDFQLRYQQTQLWLDKEANLNDCPKAETHIWKPSERKGVLNDWFTSFLLCLRREWLFVRRDKAFFYANLAQNLILGVILGTIYYQIPVGDYGWMDRYGAIFSFMVIIGMKGGSAIPTIYNHRRVYYKQKRAKFFQPSAYAAAGWLVQIPYVIFDALTFGSLFYFLTGFSVTNDGTPYLWSVASVIAGGLAMQQFFRTLCYIMPDETAALSVMGLGTLFLILFSGYVTSLATVPKYWIWCMYANPFFYLFQGLTVNEFTSAAWGGQGVQYLNALGLHLSRNWIWISILMQLVITACYFGIGLLAMTMIEYQPVVNIAEELPPEEQKEDDDAPAPPIGTVAVELSRMYTSYAANHRSRLGGDIVSPTGGQYQQHFIPPQPADWMGGSQIFSTLGSSNAGDIQFNSSGGVRFATEPSFTSSHMPSGDNTMSRTNTDRSIATQQHKPKDSALAFTPMTLAFRNLSYTVTLSNGEMIELLKGINGYFKPGTITALMGSSGAGKTTLLDVLGGRKTSGIVRGELYVNAAPIEKKADKKAYLRVLGYVEQMDLHSPFSTVFEALEFSARLRLSSDVSVADQEKFVYEVLDLLELTNIGNDVVGKRGEGLSTEQRKRLTIGVELVANPSLIFLDEPTSGLDSRSAMIVIRVIKKLAMTGRTVICTIHQPSLVLFEHFDNLLLLRRGGETVYFGPLGYDSCNLIDYLQSIPGTPKFRQGENPATWMLECIGAGTSNVEKCDYATEYHNSALALKCQDELCRLIPDASTAAAAYIADPTNKLSLCLIMSLVFASVYCQQNSNDFRDLYGHVAALVLATAFIGIVDSSSAIEVHCEEKAAFARERMTKMYPIICYVLSWVLAEIPWIALQSIFFAAPFYFLSGYYQDATKFGYFLLYHFLYNVWSSYFGQFLSGLFNKQVAQVVWNTIAFLLVNFMGFTRKPHNIPTYWKFLYWALPSHYALEGIVTSQWHNVPDSDTVMVPLKGQVVAAPKTYIVFKVIFGNGFSFDNRWRNVGVLIGFSGFTIIALWAALRFGKITTR